MKLVIKMKLAFLSSIFFLASFNVSAMEQGEFDHYSGTYSIIRPVDSKRINEPISSNGTVKIKISGRTATLSDFEFADFNNFQAFEALSIPEDKLIETYGEEKYTYSIEFGEQKIAEFMKAKLLGGSFTLEQFDERKGYPPQFGFRATIENESQEKRDLRLIIDGSRLKILIEYPYGLCRGSANQLLNLTRADKLLFRESSIVSPVRPVGEKPQLIILPVHPAEEEPRLIVSPPLPPKEELNLRKIKEDLWYVLNYMKRMYSHTAPAKLGEDDQERLIQKAVEIVESTQCLPDTDVIKAAYKELFGE